MIKNLSPKFEDALVYANRVHAGQVRKKTGSPYIGHLLGVTAIAFEFGANETEAIAALLHDAVEDCGGEERLRDIRAKFGDDVARIVDGCTDTMETPKPPWRERKEKYVAHLAEADADTLLVSASDKLYNVRTILTEFHRVGDEVFERFKGGKDGSLWYYRALVEAFRARAKHRDLIDELDRTVSELEKLARV